MAFYQYECKHCKVDFEVRHGMSESPVVRCGICQKVCSKLLIVPNVVLGKTCREVWDYDEVHKVRPKWLKSKDGNTQVRYDPSKHGGHKGSKGWTSTSAVPVPTLTESSSSEDNSV